MPKPPPIVRDLDTQAVLTSREGAAAVLDHVIRNLYQPPIDTWSILAAILDAHYGDPAKAAAELASRHSKRNRVIRLVPANRQIAGAELTRILTRAVQDAIADQWANAFEPGAAVALARALTELPKPPWAEIYAHLRRITEGTAQSWTDERAARRAALRWTLDQLARALLPPTPKT